jgi:hypothetical protein
MQIDDLGRAHDRGAAKRLKSAIVAATYVFLSSPSAIATTTTVTWSSAFNDSLLATEGPRYSGSRSPLIPGGQRCFVGCGPVFGASVVRRAEFLTSNTADLSVNRIAGSTGHAMGLTGMIVTQRLEPSGFGADWTVVGEGELGSNGNHSWSLVSPDNSLEVGWFPSEFYRFDSSSSSTDFAAATPAGPIPEISTWVMMLVGLVGLSAASCGRFDRHWLVHSSGYPSGGSNETGSA